MKKNNLKIVKIDKNKSLFNYEKKILINELILDLKLGYYPVTGAKIKQQVDVNEICNAVDFFIKNSSITGQVLAIDSGQSLNWQTPDIMKGKE